MNNPLDLAAFHFPFASLKEDGIHLFGKYIDSRMLICSLCLHGVINVVGRIRIVKLAKAC